MLNINNFYKKILLKYSYHLLDTGSIEIQIILLTIKINNLIEHIYINKKDNNSKRWLKKILSKRLKFLNHLKSKKIDIFNGIVNDLNIKL
ncbi:MAG: 30S ribosomal protein S15 [Candidatus Nasuia deltocephalinicola]